MPPRQHSPRESAPLARRLRELREERWPGVVLTQETLGRALGGTSPLAVSTISSWESPTSPVTPPRRRLAAYATFFATRRSLDSDPPHLLADHELDASERAERDRLLRELLALWEAAPSGGPAAGPSRRIWHFPEGSAVRLICGRLPDEHLSTYAAPVTRNYAELLSYADLDALVELFGHIRAENPTCDVRFLQASESMSEARPDDLSVHLVLLGGFAWNRVTSWLTHKVDLPVRQVEDPSVEDGEVFEVSRGENAVRYFPTADDRDPSLGLTEDVGLFVRMPNPNNTAVTLTICNGVHSRGVLGAVRCLTDAHLRDRNEAYLASRFGDSDQFGILMRVPVMQGRTLTPQLHNANTRLFEWPERTT